MGLLLILSIELLGVTEREDVVALKIRASCFVKVSSTKLVEGVLFALSTLLTRR